MPRAGVRWIAPWSLRARASAGVIPAVVVASVCMLGACSDRPDPEQPAATQAAPDAGAAARATDPAATGEPTPFVKDQTWPEWARWPRTLEGITLYHPSIEEWRGEQLFTRSAIQADDGLTGLLTIQWSLAFDGRTVVLSKPVVATCAWDGDPAKVAAARASLDGGLAGCTWSFPVEAVLSLVSTDTMPPEPTVEAAGDLQRAREAAAAFGVDLLNDREAMFMLDRWPRDEEDRWMVPTAPAAATPPCGTWVLGPLRIPGRDGRVHELRAARWIRLTRAGWQAPTDDAAAEAFSAFAGGGSLSEERERFERTIARRDKVYGLLDRTAWRWSEAVERMHEQQDPPPPESPPG